MLSFLKRGPKVEGLTGIQIDSNGFSLAHVVHSDDGPPTLRVCEYVELEEGQKINEAIAESVMEFGLEGAECCVVLPADSYSLRLIDDPQSGGEELQEAVRYAMTDLVDFDVDEAAVDAFYLPETKGGAASRNIYAVAAPSEEIQKVVDTLEDSGLTIKSIDVIEMCLRNIASYLPENSEGLALLSIWEDSGIVTLSHSQQLCLARNVEAGMRQLQDIGGDDSFGEKQSLSAEGQEILEGLLLEIQRSLDYYEHQLGQGRAQNLIISPLPWDIPTLMTYLAQNLSMKIRVLDLSEIFEWNQDVARDLQARCLAAVGAALRVEEEVE